MKNVCMWSTLDPNIFSATAQMSSEPTDIMGHKDGGLLYVRTGHYDVSLWNQWGAPKEKTSPNPNVVHSGQVLMWRYVRTGHYDVSLWNQWGAPKEKTSPNPNVVHSGQVLMWRYQPNEVLICKHPTFESSNATHAGIIIFCAFCTCVKAI